MAQSNAGQQVFPPKKLVIFNWDAYLVPELISAFEKKFDVTVKLVYYHSDEERNRRLTKKGVEKFDIVVVSDNAFQDYIALNWVAELDPARIPNLKYLEREQLYQHQGKLYGVPYTWGTIGIAWRNDLYPKGFTSWRQLLEPEETLHGRIAMLRDPDQVVAISLKTLGFSLNTVEEKALKKAESLLLRQKPHVRSYGLLPLDESNPLLRGEITAAMTYNGDALLMRENYQDAVSFAVPEEGTWLWVDYFAVLSTSVQKDLAQAFINFMHEPENAARTSRYLFYATPNKAACAYLPAEHLSNPFVYPPEAILRKSEFHRLKKTQVYKKYHEIFQKLLMPKM